jgi:hypothetical protein
MEESDEEINNVMAASQLITLRCFWVSKKGRLEETEKIVRSRKSGAEPPDCAAKGRSPATPRGPGLTWRAGRVARALKI